jgi:hypothetical protein
MAAATGRILGLAKALQARVPVPLEFLLSRLGRPKDIWSSLDLDGANGI